LIHALRPASLLEGARLAALALALAPFGGCLDEEPGAAILQPDDVELHWNEAFNGVDDRLAAVVPVDVMVYDARTGEPLPSAHLLIGSEDANVAMLPPDSVAPVDPDLCSPDGAVPLAEPVSAGETSDPCSGLTWDAWRDLYLSIDGGVVPGEIELWTDEDGVARAYVWADAFPVDEGGFEPALVEIDLAEPDGGGVQLEAGVSFSLRPR
jgi:hypothetical protein